jgi:hypothetical protein
MAYKKPQVLAQNGAQGVYAAGCTGTGGHKPKCDGFCLSSP